MPKKPADKEWRSEIARRFGQAIEERHLSKTEAAKNLGITRQTLWLYLNAKATPGGDVLKKACKSWEITISRKGAEFSAGAFGPEREPAPKRPKQLDLFKALEILREAKFETELVARSNQYFEIRIRIQSSEEVAFR